MYKSLSQKEISNKQKLSKVAAFEKFIFFEEEDNITKMTNTVWNIITITHDIGNDIGCHRN